MRPEPLVSVIVPIYKAEGCMRKCVDSILAQTCRRIEVILVDDGSPDRCGVLCDEYAAHDPRVRVIHQSNGGVSRARNAGIEHSAGYLIAFVDADDQIAPAYIESLLAAHGGSDGESATPIPDLVIGGFVSEEHRLGRTRLHRTTLPDELYQGWEQLGEYFNKHFCKLYAGVPWGKIYKASLIKDNHIRFNEGIRFGEDYVFNLECLKHCNSLALVSSTKYRFTSSGISVEEKYRLTLEEITDYCRVIREKTEELSRLWVTHINCNALVDVEISMYPLQKVFSNPAPYITLYEKYGSAVPLLDNYHCSPVLRGIHVAKGYLKTFHPFAALRLLLAVRRHYGDVVPTLTYHGLDKYISYVCRR